MAGGGIILNNKLLYSTMLLPIIGEPYYILKYDQLVHASDGVTTLLMWTLLKPLLKNPLVHKLQSVAVMAATGAGALNEIIEFIATVISPESGGRLYK